MRKDSNSLLKLSLSDLSSISFATSSLSESSAIVDFISEKSSEFRFCIFMTLSSNSTLVLSASSSMRALVYFTFSSNFSLVWSWVK